MSNFPSLKEFAMAKKPVELPPDLQQMLAKDKVTRMLQDAEQEIAMQMAGTPPTVDKQLDEGLAKHVMRQMQQQQPAPMQPPGAAPPAAAGGLPAAMAANNQAGPSQGLAGVKSNLPQAYAGGGIIAFSNQGEVPDLSQYDPEPGDTINDIQLKQAKRAATIKALKEARQAETDKKAAETRGTWASRLGDIKDFLGIIPQNNNYEGPGEARHPAPEAETAPPAMPNPRLARQAGAGEMPPQQPPQVQAPQAGIAALPGAAKARIQQSSSVSGPQGGAYENPIKPSQAQDDTSAAVRAAIIGGAAINPEERRANEEARRFQMTDPSFQEAIKAKQEGLAALKAKQEAAVAARGEGNTILGMNASALRAMGRNQNSYGLGGAFSGVADAVQKETAGYRDADIAYQEKLNGLQAAMKDAIATNDIGKYNAGLAAYKEAEASKNDNVKTGAQLVGTDESSLGRKQIAYDAHMDRLQRMREMQSAAVESAKNRGDNRALAILNDAYNRANAVAEREAEAVQKQYADDPLRMKRPAPNISAIKADAVERALAANPAYVKAMKELGIEAPAPAAKTTDPTRAAVLAELARRQGGN